MGNNASKTYTQPPNSRNTPPVLGPSPMEYWNASKEMYDDNFNPGNGFIEFVPQPLGANKEIRAWKNDIKKEVLIAIRGTVNAKDLLTDTSIPLSRLTSTERWERTAYFLTAVWNELGSAYSYYLTGHSLGGALVTQALLHYPWIKGAREYNPAVEPNTPSDLSNKRVNVVNEKDALYKYFGTDQKSIEVVDAGSTSVLEAHYLNPLRKHEYEMTENKEKNVVHQEKVDVDPKIIQKEILTEIGDSPITEEYLNKNLVRHRKGHENGIENSEGVLNILFPRHYSKLS